MKQCRAGTGKLSLMQNADSGVYSARVYRAAETSGCWRDRAESSEDLSDTPQSFHSPPLTRTRRNARARSTNIQHIPEHRTITRTQPHIPSPHRRSVSLFLRLTFSHCSKALCHWGTSGVQGVIPFMINFNKQNCNSRSRSAAPCKSGIFLLKTRILEVLICIIGML